MATAKVTDPNRLGDIAEHYVVTWLWDEGYEVFTNAGCTGLVDMIAVKNGVPVYIDVKARNTDSDSGYRRSDDQKKLRVQIVEFNGKKRKCRWVEHQE
jgi:Holliday junction resolvase-like predicted endonuclease